MSVTLSFGFVSELSQSGVSVGVQLSRLREHTFGLAD